jgi:hypothetical protein
MKLDLAEHGGSLSQCFRTEPDGNVACISSAVAVGIGVRMTKGELALLFWAGTAGWDNGWQEVGLGSASTSRHNALLRNLKLSYIAHFLRYQGGG